LGSPKKTTVDLLNGDLAAYQTSAKLTDALLAQAGLNGGLAAYSNPYLQPWLQANFGAALPVKTTLMKEYEQWQMAQPKGADTSPEAFAAYHDAATSALGSTATATGVSNSRLMTLYAAWAKAQPSGVDASPEAFAAYLASLNQKAA